MKKLYKFLFVLLISFSFVTMSQNANAQDPYFIEVIQPNSAGIEVESGKNFLISWTDNFSSAVIIQLWKAGVKWYNIENSALGSTYTWSVPDTATLGSDYQIRIKSAVDPSISDMSENYFSIVNTLEPGIRVLNPNEPGIKWVRGSSQLLSWTDNLTEPVIIQLWKGNVKWYNIANSVEGTTYNWDVPDTKNAGID